VPGFDSNEVADLTVRTDDVALPDLAREVLTQINWL
jgi:hypothetical protein